MTIYTVITSEYDYLKPIKVPQNGNWNFICFTDQKPGSPVFDLTNDWQIRPIEIMDCGPVKTARWHKINFHKIIDDDCSIYIDGTFFVNTDLSRWWRRRFVPDFTVVQHPFDNCAYIDAFSCMSAGKGDRWQLHNQISYYRSQGMPENNGLIASGILMRRKTSKVIEFCEQWWEQVERFSERDQVAFGYANWKNPIANNTVWDYTKQKEFEHCPHRNKKWGIATAYKMAGL